MAALLSFLLLAGTGAAAAPAGTVQQRGEKETLNPEGVNPHAEAPRKKISQKKKQAAADARKRQKAEKAAQRSAHDAAGGNPSSVGSDH